MTLINCSIVPGRSCQKSREASRFQKAGPPGGKPGGAERAAALPPLRNGASSALSKGLCAAITTNRQRSFTGTSWGEGRKASKVSVCCMGSRGDNEHRTSVLTCLDTPWTETANVCQSLLNLAPSLAAQSRGVRSRLWGEGCAVLRPPLCNLIIYVFSLQRTWGNIDVCLHETLTCINYCITTQN